MTTPDAQGMDAVRRAFEEFGRQDPMYAALSRGGHKGRWEPGEFFADGRSEIEAVLAYLAGLGVDPGRGSALDFGCAVGRLTQALGGHFREATGVDIAEAMVEGARRFNQHGDRVRYLVNTEPDLALFDNGSFDLVYTNKVLQHIPPAYQLGYISEFMRVLKPGGVAVFQTRNGPTVRQGTLRSALYTLNRRHIRRLLQRVRGRVPYEMHYVSEPLVREAVEKAGGRIVDITDLSRGKPRRSLRYCAVRQ